MSNTIKEGTLKAIIDGAEVELMPKTTGDQVYLDENTPLSPKIEEMVEAINRKNDLDAVVNTRNLQTFTALSQFGGSTANTVSELFELMPTHSLLKMNVIKSGTTLNSSLPNGNVGQLIIEKETAGRGCVIFSNYEDGNIFTAIYYDGLGDWVNNRAYYSLAQLGMTTNNTLEEVYAAMPSQSQCHVFVNNNTNAFQTSMPNTNSAEITIYTGSSARGYVIFRETVTGKIWINNRYDSTFQGWKKVTLDSDLDELRLGVQLDNNADLNTITYNAWCSYSTHTQSLVNAPSSLSKGGEVSIRWIPSSTNDSYGTQILFHSVSGVNTIYERYKNGSTWGTWKQFYLKEDPVTTTVTSRDEAVIMNSGVTNSYVVKNGWCFFQVSFRVTDTEKRQGVLTTFPKPLYSKYIYFLSDNYTGGEIRISTNGSVRVGITEDLVNTDVVITGSYPVAE